MYTFRFCDLHQKDRQRFAYATNAVDVSLLRLAPKVKHRVRNVINVGVSLLTRCIYVRKYEKDNLVHI